MGNILLSATTNNIVQAAQYAANQGKIATWEIATTIVVPIVLVFLVVRIVFILFKCGAKKEAVKAQWEEHVEELIMLISIIVIVSCFGVWGAIMLGDKPAPPTAGLLQTEYLQEGDETLWMQLER